jgi:hypothetical protein
MEPGLHSEGQTMKGKIETVVVDDKKIDMMIKIIDDLIAKTRERVRREKLGRMN